MEKVIDMALRNSPGTEPGEMIDETLTRSDLSRIPFDNPDDLDRFLAPFMRASPEDLTKERMADFFRILERRLGGADIDIVTKRMKADEEPEQVIKAIEYLGQARLEKLTREDNPLGKILTALKRYVPAKETAPPVAEPVESPAANARPDWREIIDKKLDLAAAPEYYTVGDFKGIGKYLGIPATNVVGIVPKLKTEEKGGKRVISRRTLDAYKREEAKRLEELPKRLREMGERMAARRQLSPSPATEAGISVPTGSAPPVPPAPAATSTSTSEYIAPNDAFDLAVSMGVDMCDYASQMGLENPPLETVGGSKVYKKADIDRIIAKAKGGS